MVIERSVNGKKIDVETFEELKVYSETSEYIFNTVLRRLRERENSLILPQRNVRANG